MKYLINLAIFLAFTFTLTLCAKAFNACRIVLHQMLNILVENTKICRRQFHGYSIYVSCFYVICRHVPLQLYTIGQEYIEIF